MTVLVIVAAVVIGAGLLFAAAVFVGRFCGLNDRHDQGGDPR